MRKMLGALIVAALLVSAFAGSPAGAAAGTTCKVGSGTATFTPALPAASSAQKVKSVLRRSGSVSGCSGSVKSGKVTGVSPKSKGSNCTTLETFTKTPTKVTFTVKWNTGNASTIVGQLKEIPHVSVTTQTVSGAVSAGVFKGSKLSGKITYTLPKDGCTKKALAKVSYTDVGAFTIK